MKKLFFPIIFILPFFLQAQTSIYHPFPDSNAMWCCYRAVSFGCIHPPPLIDEETFSTYQINGKTIINGKFYSRLLHYEIVIDNCFVSTTTDTTTYYFRQDTIQKKVWLYNSTTNSDTIFFDFDLHVGDTIDGSKAYWARNNWIAWIVSSVDSILIDGAYRKKINYSFGDSTCLSSMIEGIGSDHGLFYQPPTCFEYFTSLSAFSQNNQQLYTGYAGFPGSQSFCQDLPLYTNVTGDNLINVFPNPFHSEIHVELPPEINNSEFKLFDLLGRLKKTEKLISRKNIITRENIPVGIYFYQIVNDKELISSGKLLIE